MLEMTGQDQDELAAWIATFGDHVRARRFDDAEVMFDRSVVSFSSLRDVVVGLDVLVDQQWRHVWPTIEEFRFDVESMHAARVAGRRAGGGRRDLDVDRVRCRRLAIPASGPSQPRPRVAGTGRDVALCPRALLAQPRRPPSRASGGRNLSDAEVARPRSPHGSRATIDLISSRSKARRKVGRTLPREPMSSARRRQWPRRRTPRP